MSPRTLHADVDIRSIGLVLVVLIALLLHGCGGDDQGSVPALIVVQPLAVRVADGQAATFSVVAGGTGPLSYQWSRNGAPIAGAQASTYTIAAASTADDGASFGVTVSNAAGTVSSATALLRVDAAAPVLIADLIPAVAVTAGQPAVFAVIVRGTSPLAFLWRRNGVAVAGATTSTYGLAAATIADDGAVFDVIVRNAAGSIGSTASRLTVSPAPIAPTITSGPVSLKVGVGAPAAFSVVATGSPAPTYQWLRNGVAIDGAQSANYAIASTTMADNGARFSVVVANVAASIASDAVALDVRAAPGLALVAGDVGGFGWLDGIGTAARLGGVTGMAMDAAGNVYFTDGRTIRRLSSEGIVTTIAGAFYAFGVVDGPGRTATFQYPSGVALDPSGNLFVADSLPIRKIAPDGTVSSLSSANPFGPFPEDVAVDRTGNLFVADSYNATVGRVAADGSLAIFVGSNQLHEFAAGVGAQAHLAPNGVAVDGAGNLIVADFHNRLVLRADPAGAVSILAGAPGAIGVVDGPAEAARFMCPYRVAVDAGASTYVTDFCARNVRKVGADRQVTTIAGSPVGTGIVDGTGPAASFARPAGIVVDAAGMLYVGDSMTIRKVSPAGVVTTVAGAPARTGSVDGVAGAARFNGPAGLAVGADGVVYVTDSTHTTVRRITPDGIVSTLAGAAGQAGYVDGPGATARFSFASGLAVDVAGNVLVADLSNQVIRKITPGGIVSTIAGAPGVQAKVDGPIASARFAGPGSLTTDALGNIYVYDLGLYNNNNLVTVGGSIRKITPQGLVTTMAGGRPLTEFFCFGFVFDTTGNLFCPGDSSISKVTPAGVVTTIAGLSGMPGHVDGAPSVARFTTPFRIAIDASNNLYVLDNGDRTIRKIDTNGNVSTIAGVADTQFGVRLGALPGHLSAPSGIGIDRAGNLYVTDLQGVIRIVQ